MKDYIQIKYMIEGLIKKGRLFEYPKYGKRIMEESLKKSQSPKKMTEVVARGKGKVAYL